MCTEYIKSEKIPKEKRKKTKGYCFPKPFYLLSCKSVDYIIPSYCTISKQQQQKCIENTWPPHGVILEHIFAFLKP